MKRTTVRTIDELIAAFGGDERVAAWLGVGRTAVGNWRVRGVPSHHHLHFWVEAERMGLSIDVVPVFGVKLKPFVPALQDRQSVQDRQRVA